MISLIHISYYSRALVLAILLSLAPFSQALSAPVQPVPPSVMFIVDNSGSMWQQVDGEPKVSIARKVLADVLESLPAESKLGLISYGHRRVVDCNDIEVISPIGSETPASLTKKVNALKPKGITPIAESLMQAAQSIKDVSGPKMIVLITDGGEECRGDPCAAARELAKSGLVVRINVVGFYLDDKKRSEVQCIAKEGKGRFFEIKDKAATFAAVDELKKEIATPLNEDGTVPVSAPVAAKVEAPAAPVTIVESPAAPVAAAPPPPPSAAKPDDVNLLLASAGGTVVKSDKPGWENTVNGRDRSSAWTWTGQEAVFGFKDGKAAKFSRFAIAIPGKQPQNVKEFELLVSDTVAGPYRLIGSFRTQNALQKSLYQEFSFSPITAKYFKFRLISNFGYEIQGWGNTQVYQLKLLGVAVPD